MPLPAALRLALASCALAATAARAEVFTFGDWAVGCDNTRRCEAVGYQAEDGGSQPVVLWLGRDAGPGTAVEGMLAVQSASEVPHGSPTLVAGKGLVVPAAADDRLDRAALARALPQLAQLHEADVRLGREHFTLSLAGLGAALAKMDEVQGRRGTPGALVRRGTRPESAVPAAPPAPRVFAAPAVPHRAGDAALLKTLVRKLRTDCQGLSSAPAGLDNTSLWRVSPSEVLLVRDCESGYNSPSDVWIVADKPPYAARRPAFESHGAVDPLAGTTNASFDGQQLQTTFKGRAAYDCGSIASWTWTGRAFVLAEAREAPLCRGLPAGGFSVRTWTSAR
jgi:hypothetical protein